MIGKPKSAQFEGKRSIEMARMEMCKFWRISFKQFSNDFPKSNKIKSKARRSNKYKETCFKLKRERREELNDEIFSEAFEVSMR